MASTRNKNMMGNFNLEMIQNDRISSNRTNPYRTEAHETRFPDFGVNQGHIPNQIYGQNAVDVESYLKGVGATKLVKYETYYKYHIKPENRSLRSLSFFDKPTSNEILPQPFLVEKNQRPFIP